MATKLSPILTELRRILAGGIHRIDNDECSETYAMGLVSKFNAESKGYYNKDSLVNYDKAMRITGIKNRNKFLELCKKHNIEQKTLNNQSVGFLKCEIEQLATILRKQREDGSK